MHHTLKNIRHNGTFFNSKSATHETFVTGKFIFRICHEFLMLLRGQTAGTLLRYLCHLFPRIITRYSTCHGRNFEALFAVKSYLILSSTSRLNWRFCVGKLLFPSQSSRSPATYHSKLTQPRVTCTQAFAGMSPQQLNEQHCRVYIPSTTILLIAKDAFTVKGCLMA